MADTKKGRNEQARNAENRQRERELEEARDRADEAEPSRDGQGETEGEAEDADRPRTCHRRGCEESAEFTVLERYQEETGHGAVEAEVALCRKHTAEESPTNLDGAYEDYVFRVEPLPATTEATVPETRFK